MQIAAGQLVDTNRPIYLIAEAVGYESEASFCRAFRRATGRSPGIWRSERRQEAELAEARHDQEV
ncbi:helix-turn-helix domain-containing protein [uncultured Rhodospira sp.]|uniref:helix-turn-helix domain-containing protein n=1 Tax=uncultured Rhodospira sp. TaxID=1936189 RepID=UPI00345A496D